MKNKALLQTNMKTRVLQLFILLAIILLIVSLIGCDDEQSIIPKEEKTQPTQPKLLLPANGSTVDNGCMDRSNPVVWKFEWESVPEAQAYHLFVKGANATYPLIDDANIQTTSFQYNCADCYIISYHSTSWAWKVRALIKGTWTDWSERKFDLEEVDTDC